MTRRLLPYEHDLIATLGVTEEEYIDFLSIQETYSDPKEGTIVDIRNMPQVAAAFAVIGTAAATAATTAVVLTTISTALTVVGILFQVASVLLAEKPSAPKAARNHDLVSTAHKNLHSTAIPLTLSIAIPVRILLAVYALARHWCGLQ